MTPAYIMIAFGGAGVAFGLAYWFVEKHLGL